AARIGAGTGRPLLAGKDVGGELARLIDQRAPMYEAAAHLKVSGSGTVDEVATRVLEALGTRKAPA
ncbi:MAG: shikimate kinase, partial [Acidimicrobiia bacterium]